MNLNTQIRAQDFVLKKEVATDLLKKIGLIMTFVVLMGISANSFIYLPYTPVPLTLQVLTVLASGIFLGSRLAFFSQLSYIMLGLAGFPIFAGFKSGIAALLGPTGGFIIGFIFAAAITGYIYERAENSKFSKNILCFFACASGLACIYMLGFIYLYLLFSATLSLSSAVHIFNLAVRPFVLMDLFKIMIIIYMNKVIAKNEKDLL
jgi:biotin transport system substrate-specific component